MKKASRHYKVKVHIGLPSHREIVTYKLQRLQELIRDEIEFGVPSYEDGSLSPKHGLQEIFNKVVELDQLMNQHIDNVKLSTQSIQPPATPEALDDISEAIE
jgi:hypothetical protein